MKINKTWHEQHKMPQNATFEQRVQWHLEHLKNCQCHPSIPRKLAEEMVKKGIKAPTP